MRFSLLIIGTIDGLYWYDKPVKINYFQSLRTFMELEDLAADVFNRDEAVLETFDAVSWRQQFMEYGCYCNTRVIGAGTVNLHEEDPNDYLCKKLHQCYKCLNMDYGVESVNNLVYFAHWNGTSNVLTCSNQNGPLHQGLCECDMNFIKRTLANYKQCQSGDEDFCHNNDYFHNNDFTPNTQCNKTGAKRNNNPQCCGTYPWRNPFNASNKSCCDGVLRQPGSC